MIAGGRLEALATVPAGVSFTATNSGGGPTAITITPGTYYITALVAHVVAQLNALRTPANWTGSLSTGANGTGQVTLNWTGAGTYSIAWTASGTTLRDILGFTIDLAGVTQGVASVGAKQARGLFLPGCPLMMDGSPKRAPLGSDHRTTVSPDGETFGLVGPTFYRQRNLRYSHVQKSRLWEAEAAIANSSWEYFFKETQLGQTSSWFTVTSKLNIYFDAGGVDTLVGSDLPVSGWKLPKPMSLDNLALVDASWDGLMRIELGDAFSRG